MKKKDTETEAGGRAGGFKRSVAQAQAHSVIRPYIAREDLEQHRTTQLKNMKNHEHKLSRFLISKV